MTRHWSQDTDRRRDSRRPRAIGRAALPGRWSHRRGVAAAALLGGCLLIAGLGLVLRVHVPTRTTIARVGRELPTLSVTKDSGRVFDLSQVVRGRRTVIVFYSPECDICRSELPQLSPFPEALDLYLVSERKLDSLEVPPALASATADLFYDHAGALGRVFPMAGVPTLLLVDENGVLREAMVGARERKLVQQTLWEFARGDGAEP